MDTTTPQEDRDAVWTMIKDIRFASMVTRTADGAMRSRPMTAQGEGEGDTLWFFTDTRSGKMDDIAADPRVLIVYADPSSQAYVSVAGRATAVDDRAKIHELWSEPTRTWFPDGPESPQIGLIRVEMETAEYWDAPAGVMAMAYGYAKARLTGEAPDFATHGKVAM